jgi:hypothetical protein
MTYYELTWNSSTRTGSGHGGHGIEAEDDRVAIELAQKTVDLYRQWDGHTSCYDFVLKQGEQIVRVFPPPTQTC